MTPEWGLPRQTAAAALLGVLLVLSGCEAEQDSGDAAASVSPPQTATTNTFIERQVHVTLTEGTNMAVAVDSLSQDRVVSLQGTLFLLPAQGGAPRALTDAYFDAREPQFSPDGRFVIFQGYRNGNWDLWQVASAGGAPKAITHDAFDDREPQYSADGSQVVFSSDRSGRYDIWQIDLLSGALSQLTQTGHNAYAPSLSANATLAYVEEGGGGARLMVRDPSGASQLLVEESGTIAGVQWSPDGAAIAYQLMGAKGSELKVASLANKTARTVSNPGADIFPFKAHWLGNQQLAYTADGKIFTRDLNAEGRQAWPFEIELTLTRHDYQRRPRDYDAGVERLALGLNSPVISNDGEHIYFSALGDLWHWQPSRNRAEKLTDDGFAEYAPALSPDGQTLAFVADSDGVVGLRLMDLHTQAVATVPLQATQVSNPSWSPDGTQLAFFVGVPGNPLGGQMLVLEMASGKTTRVLEPMPAQPISWSVDGRRVAVSRLAPYSTRYREGIHELLVVDVASSNYHAIVPQPHRSLLNGVLAPDGAMTYVQGGLLHRLELDADFQPLEIAGPITNELTDTPQWSANGEYLVYLSGRTLKRWHRVSGTVADVTPKLLYHIDAPQERYVLHAGRVFTGTTNEYLENQYIWVNGPTIEKIAPPAQIDGLEVIDLTDKVVVPGLFEMHAHMGENSESQGRVWLSYGVTTVRDPGSNPYVAKERQEAWDSGRRPGPRTHITGYLTDGNRVYYSMAEGIVSEQHLDMALERTQQLGLDFIKTYVRLPDHWQKRVVDFAHNLGIPVSSHELYPAVAHGMDHVEHIGGTSRRGYQPKVTRLGYAYGDVVELISASGMGLTATAVLPGFSVILSDEPDWFDSPQFAHFYGPQARRTYEMIMARFGGGARGIAKANGGLLKTLTERDALLVTGTDSPFVPYGAGLHAEFRLYARAGVANADIIRQATLKSAQAAGVAAELGTLEAGKLADMVVIDGDPLANIGDLDNVAMTIKNGHRFELEQLLIH